MFSSQYNTLIRQVKIIGLGLKGLIKKQGFPGTSCRGKLGVVIFFTLPRWQHSINDQQLSKPINTLAQYPQIAYK
jgi:hypothetical protein